MNKGTLTAVVFGTVLLLGAAGCKKKAPTPPPPPPPKQEAAVAPPPPPPPPKAQPVRINNFAVEPRTIQRGQSGTLSWSVANATDISINQSVGAVQANGMRQVFPSTSTTYTLTATGPGGMDSRAVTLEVVLPPPPQPPPQAKPRISGSDILSQEGRDAFFDYDKSDIRDDARTALTQDADLLKRIFMQDPQFTVVLEGHCDERGSAEYNLGLGDRRSTSARDFLVQLGVPGDRIRTISFGKDRPQCTDASEDCYQRNRRVHLVPAQ
jgi:peptidoglycan-associated lipoprotein